MKVIEALETPILSTEVFSVLYDNPANKLAFSKIDPLENSLISDPNELRKLVTVRRTCHYLDSCVGVTKYNHDRLPTTVALFTEMGLSPATIVHLIDTAALLCGDPNVAELYMGESMPESSRETILQEIRVLMGNSPIDETPRKRKLPTPRK